MKLSEQANKNSRFSPQNKRFLALEQLILKEFLMIRKMILFFYIFFQCFTIEAKNNEPKKKKEDLKTAVLKKVASKKKEAPKKEVSSKKKLSETDVRKLHGKLHPFEALSLNFTESLYRKARKKTIKKKGSVYIIKPNKFKWTVGNQIWIYDGKDLISFRPLVFG